MIGTRLNFTAGTLTYTSTLGLQVIIPVIVGPVVFVLLLSMLVICVIICVTRSSARAKDKRLTTLLSQMETLRTPTVTENNQSMPGISQCIALYVVAYLKINFVSYTTGKTAGFQVTDEFITQLPQQLIVPSSHLQISKSIGEGNLQTNKLCSVLDGVSHFYTNHVVLFPGPHPAFCLFTC